MIPQLAVGARATFLRFHFSKPQGAHERSTFRFTCTGMGAEGDARGPEASGHAVRTRWRAGHWVCKSTCSAGALGGGVAQGACESVSK